MEPVSLILAALTAGALAAAKDTTSQAVKDAYAELKSLVKKHFAGKPEAEIVLTGYEKDEDTWKKPLHKYLVEAGADQDESIVQQAHEVLKLVNPQQASQGKYNVQIGEGKGIVIGDYAHIEHMFGEE